MYVRTLQFPKDPTLLILESITLICIMNDVLFEFHIRLWIQGYLKSLTHVNNDNHNNIKNNWRFMIEISDQCNFLDQKQKYKNCVGPL